MKAVLVLGPESSGTRMLTEAFVRAGYQGDYGESQRCDDFDFSRMTPMDFVFRRSYPHGGVIPDCADLVDQLNAVGYHDVHAAIILRGKHATACSQVARGHVADYDAAIKAISLAVKTIFTQIAEMRLIHHVVCYESFVRSSVVRDVFFANFGKTTPAMEFRDENMKYRLEMQS